MELGAIHWANKVDWSMVKYFIIIIIILSKGGWVVGWLGGWLDRWPLNSYISPVFLSLVQGICSSVVVFVGIQPTRWLLLQSSGPSVNVWQVYKGEKRQGLRGEKRMGLLLSLIHI